LHCKNEKACCFKPILRDNYPQIYFFCTTVEYGQSYDIEVVTSSRNIASNANSIYVLPDFEKNLPNRVLFFKIVFQTSPKVFNKKIQVQPCLL